jgi:2-aminoadipate transaminase
MLPFATRLQNVETSAIREIFKLLGKPGIISLAGGFPDANLFDVEGIREASARALADNPGAVLQYGATEGHQPLREEIAKYMAGKGEKQGLRVEPTGLITTTGSQQALDLIGKTMISPGDKVIVEAPTFLATIQCFRLYGADLVGAPIDADGVKVDVLEQLIIEHKPKLIYLIPNFGNPSGAMLSLERRKRILALAVQHKVLVIEDDPYGELYFNAPPPPTMLELSNDIPGSRDWLAYCGSLSKVMSPGLRVGWLIAHPSLLQNAVMCKQFADAHTSNLAQATAYEYLKMNRMAAALAKVRPAYAERAQALCANLKQVMGNSITFSQPQGGMFVWARLTSPGADAREFAKQAIERGVAFIPGTPFFAVNPDHATLRFSFATSSVEKIAEGVARLKG